MLKECNHYRFYAEFSIEFPENIIEAIQQALNNVICKPIADMIHITSGEIGNNETGGYIEIVIHALKDISVGETEGIIGPIFSGHGLTPSFTITPLDQPPINLATILIGAGAACFVIYLLSK